MIRWKKPIGISLILIILILLAGCWDYRELDEMAITAGMAVDKIDGSYLITTEIIDPKTGPEGAKIESTVFEGMGRAVFDAVRNIIRKSGKKLFWSHAKILIFSESLARENIISVLDWINRDAEVRGDMWVIVSKEETAKIIFEGEKGLYDVLMYQIQDIMRAEEHLSRFPTMEIWEFLNDLQEEGSGAVAAGIYLVPYQGKSIPQVSGSALFKGDKMVGWLDDIETRAMLWVRNEVHGGLIMTEEVGKEDTKVVMEVFNSKTKVKPVYERQKLKMKIDVSLDVGIGELSTTKNYFTEEGIKLLEKATEAVVEKQIDATIRKVQQDYNTDVFGFAQTIKREMPDLWKSIKGDWDHIFPNLDTEINIKVKITGTALTNKPIRLGD